MDLLSAARIYTQVVELGSISAVARELDLGHASVRERIEKLEEFLQVRLLSRDANGLVCTEEGKTFYNHCKTLLAAADAAVAVVRQGEQEDIRGSVRIASAQCFGEIVLPAILLRIRIAYPKLHLDVILNDAVVDPVTEGVDISLRVGSLAEGSFVAHPLGQIGRVLVAAPSFIERHDSIETPDDLVRHPFIRVNGIFPNDRVPLSHPEKGVRQARIQTSCTTSHWRPMYELIQSGCGIGVVQQPACIDALRKGSLVQLLPEYTVPPFPIHALVHAHRPTASRVRAVLDQLKKDVPAALEGTP
ncbi:LysR family transcriptional regulator [Pigmentiphaga sp. YJ18]|uniref:LysR family transcriptional regulator n=1 Tax=Pigmentiphaga sp. YJ18 TaxID=3134907 RepID=UPI0031110988